MTLFQDIHNIAYDPVDSGMRCTNFDLYRPGVYIRYGFYFMPPDFYDSRTYYSEWFDTKPPKKIMSLFVILKISLLTIAAIGYIIACIGVVRIKNPRILLHYISPASGLSLWSIILYMSMSSPGMITYILVSMISVPITTQTWMKYFLNKIPQSGVKYI